jgi:hypothetical protein
MDCPWDATFSASDPIKIFIASRTFRSLHLGNYKRISDTECYGVFEDHGETNDPIPRKENVARNNPKVVFFILRSQI